MNGSSENQNETAITQRAYLGGGCFWCLEAVYERIRGVSAVVSGYAGGNDPSPDYQSVSTGKTGHAEVVEIEFDPRQISYKEILDIFWKAHDPTTRNRQGADIGSQYRSIILTSDDEQAEIARKSLKDAQSGFNNRIVTEIAALEKFFPGEDYHQGYFSRNPYAGYCRVVIAPKLEKMKHQLTRNFFPES